MSKFGLIAAIMGAGFLAAGILLRLLAPLHTVAWLWMPGAALLAGGSALFLWARRRPAAMPMPPPKSAVGTDTARLLDNYEQRFAELKGRKPSVTVLGDLYTLGNQLEQRGRSPQATAVYRHLARFDNTYKDVATRLRRLMDTDRTKAKGSAATAAATQAAMGATTPNLRAAAPSTRPAAPAVPDTERLGRYQLEREIGRGAMGIVYLGRDTAINRMVAIKAIPLASEFSDAELIEARSRFFR
jgi:eukaryotic-like serine/threonine-protein kinase